MEINHFIMAVRLILLMVILSTASLFPAVTEGHWFGARKELPAGYEFRQLKLTDKKEYIHAVFSRLGFNEFRGWEEFRITGRLTNGVFRPVHCNIYRVKKLNQKWKLHGTFECDHLSFAIVFGKNSVTVTPAFSLKNSEELVYAGSGEIYGLFVAENTVWGAGMERVRKGARARISGAEIKIESVTDSTAKLSTRGLKPGQTVAIVNPPSGSLFD